MDEEDRHEYYNRWNPHVDIKEIIINILCVAGVLIALGIIAYFSNPGELHNFGPENILGGSSRP